MTPGTASAPWYMPGSTRRWTRTPASRRRRASEPRRAFTRSQLLDAVWGVDWFSDDHVVDVHVGKLRKKLGESGSRPRFVHTVRGVGFRFEPNSKR